MYSSHEESVEEQTITIVQNVAQFKIEHQNMREPSEEIADYGARHEEFQE